MTAFYVYRLISLTFFGGYRGPAWEAAGGGHGAARGRGAAAGHGDAHGASDHGRESWHGPHEAPRSMTVPLVLLAVGATVAGFVGVPPALGGGNAIETFLEPSFVAHASAGAPSVEPPSHAAEAAAPGPAGETAAHGAAGAEGSAHMSAAGERWLMVGSVLVGVIGILVAYRIYVQRPQISARLAARWAAPHRVLTNKYYVDELYGATFVRGTVASADGLWAFDRSVVDGMVNGSGWFTIFSSWLSHLIDKYIVDGLVNLAGSVFHEASFLFRRVQTGLIQNYALLMVLGVFAFVSIYLLVR
jgi:NADH-quinone oxidoreductase subunit L